MFYTASFFDINLRRLHHGYLSGVIMMLLMVISTATVEAQYRRVTVGAGIAPLHRPGQTDFAAASMPYDVYASFHQGAWGVRIDYNWRGSYIKERFTTTNTSTELSLQYSLRPVRRLPQMIAHARVGAVRRSTVLTTEGYPGINDYEFKIEEDQGYGAIVALGAGYQLGAFGVGLEAQFAKLGTARFIAGGFEPQPLVTDQFRLMLTAHYTISVTSDARGGIVYCPSF